MRGGRVICAVTDEELFTTSDWSSDIDPNYVRGWSSENPMGGRYIKSTVEALVRELRFGECVDVGSYSCFLIVHELQIPIVIYAPSRVDPVVGFINGTAGREGNTVCALSFRPTYAWFGSGKQGCR
jgi:hypothetical protein